VGVLACYDVVGQEMLEACALADLRVPDDVAVLGVDNDELFCNLTSPPLSSIEPDALRTGFLAAELLDGMMAGRPRTADVRRVPPLRIATRRSSDIIADDEPFLAAALRYIRDHADQALTVQTVVDHSPLSRRALEYRFTTVLGRTMHSEIVRVRMARVAALLASTGLPLPRIAERLGLRTPRTWEWSSNGTSACHRARTGATSRARRQDDEVCRFATRRLSTACPKPHTGCASLFPVRRPRAAREEACG
jgi:LacI family transcriptional regulator